MDNTLGKIIIISVKFLGCGHGLWSLREWILCRDKYVGLESIMTSAT